MISRDFANQFATEWIAAWNSHGLNQILSHYTEDFEMSSPYITQVTGEASGTLKGQQLVGAYWTKALQRSPTLHFELVSTLIGVESITLYYRGARGMAAEVFFFNSDNQVYKACAHYL